MHTHTMLSLPPVLLVSGCVFPEGETEYPEEIAVLFEIRQPESAEDYVITRMKPAELPAYQEHADEIQDKTLVGMRANVLDIGEENAATHIIAQLWWTEFDYLDTRWDLELGEVDKQDLDEDATVWFDEPETDVALLTLVDDLPTIFDLESVFELMFTAPVD